MVSHIPHELFEGFVGLHPPWLTCALALDERERFQWFNTLRSRFL
jgi:hypothetical protein